MSRYSEEMNASIGGLVDPLHTIMVIQEQEERLAEADEADYLEQAEAQERRTGTIDEDEYEPDIFDEWWNEPDWDTRD